MNGRLYDPVMGRFVSADFMIQAPDNLQSYNWSAIIALQSANFIGGVCFYFFENYRSEITFAVAAFCLIYPLRKFVVLSQEINRERKLRESH